MIVQTGIRRVSKRTKLTESCEGQEVVESYDCPRPEETQHIKDMIEVFLTCQVKCYNLCLKLLLACR